MLPKKENLTVLDAGCGHGHLLMQLEHFHPSWVLYGIDNNDKALIKAKKRTTAQLSQQDITKLNFPVEMFDIIICMDVIEHIEQSKETLLDMKQLLKPNGIMIFTFPNNFNWTFARFILNRKPYKIPHHINNVTPRWLSNRLELPVHKVGHIPFRKLFLFSLSGVCMFRK